MTDDAIPKEWTCECGTVHEFGVYYAAHATELMFHTCGTCGAEHRLLNYAIRLTKRGNPPQKTERVS